MRTTFGTDKYMYECDVNVKLRPCVNVIMNVSRDLDVNVICDSDIYDECYLRNIRECG